RYPRRSRVVLGVGAGLAPFHDHKLGLRERHHPVLPGRAVSHRDPDDFVRLLSRDRVPACAAIREHDGPVLGELNPHPDPSVGIQVAGRSSVRSRWNGLACLCSRVLPRLKLRAFPFMSCTSRLLMPHDRIFQESTNRPATKMSMNLLFLSRVKVPTM